MTLIRQPASKGHGRGSVETCSRATPGSADFLRINQTPSMKPAAAGISACMPGLIREAASASLTHSTRIVIIVSTSQLFDAVHSKFRRNGSPDSAPLRNQITRTPHRTAPAEREMRVAYSRLLQQLTESPSPDDASPHSLNAHKGFRWSRECRPGTGWPGRPGNPSVHQ